MPSACTQEKDSITPFSVLLGAISSQLNAEDVRKIRTQLYGHVNKECLDSVHDGNELLDVLQKRGLVNSKKLSFIRKLLSESKLLSLVELLDDYKREEADSINAACSKVSGNADSSQRLRSLQQVLDRQKVELANCFTIKDNLRRKLEDKEALFESQKQAIVVGEDSKDSLVETVRIEDAEREHLEERLQECESMITLQEKELKDMQSHTKGWKTGKVKPWGLSVSPKKERRISKSVVDSDKGAASLKKQSEDKQVTITKLRENKKDLCRNLRMKRATVRSLNIAILKKTDDLIDIDQHLLQTMEGIRKLKCEVRQNEFDIFDVQRELEGTEEEIEDTKKGNTVLCKTKIPVWRFREEPSRKKPSSSKTLDYNNASEDNSYCIGSLGSKICPTQFNFPCSVAVDRKSNIYVADHVNRRVHILDEMGEAVKEAIDLGNTFPTAIAVNKRGNIFVTDSQILKVFSSDGALSHNFLPVYGRKDQRPEISALTVDKEGNIFIADQSNCRIQKFRMDGHFVGFIGGPQFLDSPSGVAVTKRGDVIVSEFNSCQLKLFYHSGTSYDVIGRPGIGKAQFGNPRGLAVDNGGNILIADTANHRIQVLTLKGEYVGSLGRLGSNPGCLDSPYAVAVNRVGHVVVADAGNHRVTIFT